MSNLTSELLKVFAITFVLIVAIHTAIAYVITETDAEPTQIAGDHITIDDFLNHELEQTPVTYQTITIVDKEYKQRSFRSDVYNVVLKTEDGDIIKRNDMDLYYSVDEGKSYNASFQYGFNEVVSEGVLND